MPEIRPVVIKIGGALVGTPERLEPLWKAVASMNRPVLVVHGGGPQATEMARRLGHEPRIVQGRRVTTDLDLDIIHWTLRGALNTRLVAQALARGVRAVGVSGIDDRTIRVVRRPPRVIEGETIDFGLVGDIVDVDSSFVEAVLSGGRVPILATMGIDASGQTYNVNADTVACSLASALQTERFYLVTETGGLRRDVDDPASVLPTCSKTLFGEGLRDGWIGGGMQVKLKVAFDAVETGIPDVRILAPEDVLRPDAGTRITTID